MVIMCCVADCGEKRRLGGPAFFGFPEDPKLCKKWCDRIGRENFLPTKSSRVCAKHFHSRDILKVGSRKNLKNGAIPWILERNELKSKRARKALKAKNRTKGKRSSTTLCKPESQSADGSTSETCRKRKPILGDSALEDMSSAPNARISLENAIAEGERQKKKIADLMKRNTYLTKKMNHWSTVLKLCQQKGALPPDENYEMEDSDVAMETADKSTQTPDKVPTTTSGTNERSSSNDGNVTYIRNMHYYSNRRPSGDTFEEYVRNTYRFFGPAMINRNEPIDPNCMNNSNTLRIGLEQNLTAFNGNNTNNFINDSNGCTPIIGFEQSLMNANLNTNTNNNFMNSANGSVSANRSEPISFNTVPSGNNSTNDPPRNGFAFSANISSNTMNSSASRTSHQEHPCKATHVRNATSGSLNIHNDSNNFTNSVNANALRNGLAQNVIPNTSSSNANNSFMNGVNLIASRNQFELNVPNGALNGSNSNIFTNSLSRIAPRNGFLANGVSNESTYTNFTNDANKTAPRNEQNFFDEALNIPILTSNVGRIAPERNCHHNRINHTSHEKTAGNGCARMTLFICNDCGSNYPTMNGRNTKPFMQAETSDQNPVNNHAQRHAFDQNLLKCVLPGNNQPLPGTTFQCSSINKNSTFGKNLPEKTSTNHNNSNRMIDGITAAERRTANPLPETVNQQAPEVQIIGERYRKAAQAANVANGIRLGNVYCHNAKNQTTQRITFQQRAIHIDSQILQPRTPFDCTTLNLKASKITTEQRPGNNLSEKANENVSNRYKVIDIPVNYNCSGSTSKSAVHDGSTERQYFPHGDKGSRAQDELSAMMSTKRVEHYPVVQQKSSERSFDVTADRRLTLARAVINDLYVQPVLNKFLSNVGVPENWTMIDVIDLDDEHLDNLPKKVKAVLLLFPKGEHHAEHCEAEQSRIENEGQVVSDRVYFIKLDSNNTSGTASLIHAIANADDELALEEDSPLKEFLERTKDMSPEERGQELEMAEALCGMHEEVAKEGQTEAPEADEETNLHFITFVAVDEQLYELDAHKSFPINHGSTSMETLLKDAVAVCKQFMNRDPENVNFSIVAMVGAEE